MTFKKGVLPFAISAVTSSMTFAQDNVGSAANVDTLEEVYVNGVQSAELNARQAERQKDVFSSIISQDDAGNFADQNVAESLQRLPGITLQKTEGEGKFINLRGLGPGFVSVQMNGAEMANGGSGSGDDNESRSFSLDSIPADVLQSIEVLKSLTPDLDLNSIGGTVNVTTASALDKGENSLRIRVQDFYQDYAQEHSPRITLQGNAIFIEDKLGLNYSLSYEDRATEGYESLHHDSILPRLVTANSGADAPSLLIPHELQNRMESAERERVAGIFTLDFRPDENSSYYARFSNTRYTDTDTAIREYYRFGQAGYSASNPDGDEIYYVNAEENIFGATDVELQQQFFFQEAESDTKVFAIGGENLIANSWVVDYDVTVSKSTLENPDGRRVQFRLRDLSAIGQFGEDFINGQIVNPAQLAALGEVTNLQSIGGFGPSGYQDGQVVQPFMLYDNLFMEQSFREDTVDQFSLNVRKDFNEGFLSYVKAGFLVKNRERQRDKDRQSIVPGDKAVAGCAGNLDCVTAAGSRLGDYSTFIPAHPNFDHATITAGDAEALLAATRAIAQNYDPTNSEVESTRNDYNITEDAAAAYFMAEFNLSDTKSLIAGVRYEQTDFNSTGFMSIRNDREESSDQLESFDIALPLADTENSYSDFFPSVHYRDELRDDLLFRASLWTSFTRPSFDQARAYFQVRDRVIFCNFDPAANLAGEDQCSDRPADLQGDLAEADFTDAYKAQNLEMSSENTIQIGNPQIDPMLATNFDTSIGWYASEDLFFQAAIFYKSIDDFIVEANGLSINIQDLSFDLPLSSVTRFAIPADLQLNNVQSFINGDNAEVYGLELTYNQYFNEGFVPGLFLQSNLTLLSSEADYGDTVYYKKLAAPEQADVTFNGTLGWQNEFFSARFITNYQSEALKAVGVCPDPAASSCREFATVYQDASLTHDIKLTFDFENGVSIYFDAINITEEAQAQYFEGNQFSNGRIMYRLDDYGRSFQIGLQASFF